MGCGWQGVGALGVMGGGPPIVLGVALSWHVGGRAGDGGWTGAASGLACGECEGALPGWANGLGLPARNGRVSASVGGSP